MEYEAYVRSYTNHHIFKLYREVPKIIMSGKTAKISLLCEHGLFEWVEICSTTVFFPEDVPVIRYYLGLSIVIGPAMTTKNLIPTG